MEILLAEDGVIDARITTLALQEARFRHRLTWVRRGDEALEFLMRSGKFALAPQPDLILLDLRLPGLDGIQVLAAIKSDDRLAAIPVVVTTASLHESDVRSCEELRVDRYLTKPIDTHKFVALVQSLHDHWHQGVALPAIG